MVTEVFGRGQDAHVDHANIDDVASGHPIDFLDLTKQSPSKSHPRRVVPTISIILYFNAVGGIRFPYADGMHTIAGKRGRMILFENYDDSCRPAHKTSAKHYGIYFEEVPKRILVMGVLANQTPPMEKTSEPTKGLIYCAGTERDPLFHDNPSYDMYKRGAPSQPEVKPDLIVTLEVTRKDEEKFLVVGRSMGGEQVFQEECVNSMSIGLLHNTARARADRADSHNVILCRMDGELLTKEEHFSKPLSEVFGDAAKEEEAKAGGRFGLCGSKAASSSSP